MTRRQRTRARPALVTMPLGVVACGRRRGVRLAVVEHDGREAVELRHVALSPAAAVATRSHAFAIPLDALPAVLALLSAVKAERQP